MKNIIMLLTVSLMISPAFAKGSKAAPVQNKAEQPAAAAVKTDKTAKTADKTKDNTAAQKNLPSDKEKQDIINNFTAWDKKLKSLKVDYTQETSFEGVLISSSQGRLYKKDNNIRLDTLDGAKVTQSAVTDKKIIKIYDGKGKEITTLSWQEWEASQPNKALFDFGNYSRVVQNHTITNSAKTEGGYILNLSSKDSDGKYTLDFELGPDYFPKTITVSGEGVSTKTVLTSATKNSEIQESVFK